VVSLVSAMSITVLVIIPMCEQLLPSIDDILRKVLHIVNEPAHITCKLDPWVLALLALVTVARSLLHLGRL